MKRIRGYRIGYRQVGKKLFDGSQCSAKNVQGVRRDTRQVWGSSALAQAGPDSCYLLPRNSWYYGLRINCYLQIRYGYRLCDILQGVRWKKNSIPGKIFAFVVKGTGCVTLLMAECFVAVYIVHVDFASKKILAKYRIYPIHGFE